MRSYAKDDENLWWARGMYLHERFPLPAIHEFNADFRAPINVTNATQSLARWRTSVGGDENRFAQWLHAASVTEDEFLYLLGESAETLFHKLPKAPLWFRSLDKAFSQFRRTEQSQSKQAYLSLFSSNLALWFRDAGPGSTSQTASEVRAVLSDFNGNHEYAKSKNHKSNDKHAFMWGTMDAAKSEVRGRTADREAPVYLLMTVAEPIIQMAQQRLQKGLKQLALQQKQHKQSMGSSDVYILYPNSLSLNASLVSHSLMTALVTQLFSLFGPALILEFQIAVLRGLVEKELPLSRRVLNFANHLRGRQASLAFFAAYPVLARQAMTLIDHWLKNSLNVIKRLKRDWSSICQLFPEAISSELQSIIPSLGDHHQGGSSVCALRFTSGFRLIYKPRSLSCDVHVQKFLEWLNEMGQSPEFRTLRVLDCKSYGWMEYVDAQGCGSSAEVERFYLRQGANLAILYLLGATDIHYENLIASGEYPVLVDLETLIYAPADLISSKDISGAERLAHELISTSVLRTLLLPQRFFDETDEGASDHGVEISGLGGAPGQRWPGHVSHLGGFEIDDLRFQRRQAILPRGNNRPRLHEEDIEAAPYLPQVIEGFTKTYKLLLLHQNELLEVGNPLARFATDTTRIVVRATAQYALLRRLSLHPYLLRDALDQERILQSLWRTAELRPELVSLIPLEIADLLQGDIPYFTARVNSRDLWRNGRRCITNYFSKTGFDALQHRCQQLSEQDMAMQQWFISASFTTWEIDGWKVQTDAPRSLMEQGRQEESEIHFRDASQNAVKAVSYNELLGVACELGDRICQHALYADESATWFGVDLINERQWSLQIADLSLYGGLAGISLALAYLGSATGIEKYTQIARAGYATIHLQITTNRANLTDIGFFSGWGGIIAALTHLGVLWQDDNVLQDAIALVDHLGPLIAQDEKFDVIGGSAGCVGGLLCLAPFVSSPARSRDIEQALRRCGDRLSETAMSMSKGVGWLAKYGPYSAQVPLTGLAHGAAGITWALLKLAQHHSNRDMYQLALGALAYEQATYDGKHKNWPDLRWSPTGGEKVYQTVWCYGAPGIGLARMDTLDVLDTAEIRADIEAAVETTIREGFGSGNYSLCHGDLGNLEVLSCGLRHLPSERLHAIYEAIKAQVFLAGMHNEWHCGTPQYVETPGLMIGWAGIVLQLLRLALPERIPSVLTMEPPLR